MAKTKCALLIFFVLGTHISAVPNRSRNIFGKKYESIVAPDNYDNQNQQNNPGQSTGNGQPPSDNGSPSTSTTTGNPAPPTRNDPSSNSGSSNGQPPNSNGNPTSPTGSSSLPIASPSPTTGSTSSLPGNGQSSTGSGSSGPTTNSSSISSNSGTSQSGHSEPLTDSTKPEQVIIIAPVVNTPAESNIPSTNKTIQPAGSPSGTLPATAGQSGSVGSSSIPQDTGTPNQNGAVQAGAAIQNGVPGRGPPNNNVQPPASVPIGNTSSVPGNVPPTNNTPSTGNANPGNSIETPGRGPPANVPPGKQNGTPGNGPASNKPSENGPPGNQNGTPGRGPPGNISTGNEAPNSTQPIDARYISPQPEGSARNSFSSRPQRGIGAIRLKRSQNQVYFNNKRIRRRITISNLYDVNEANTKIPAHDIPKAPK